MSVDEGFPLAAPGAHGLHQAWYDANVERSALTAQRCECGQFRMPARYRCSRCLSDRWDFEPVSPVGTIRSWTVTHRPFHAAFAGAVPYAILIVDVAEGVRFFVHARPGLAEVGELDRDALIGLSVELCVDEFGVPFARW